MLSLAPLCLLALCLLLLVALLALLAACLELAPAVLRAPPLTALVVLLLLVVAPSGMGTIAQAGLDSAVGCSDDGRLDMAGIHDGSSIGL